MHVRSGTRSAATRGPGLRAALAAVVLSGALGCDGAASVAADPDAVTAVATPSSVRRGEFRRVVLLTGELRARRGEVVRVPRLPNWTTTIRWMVDDGSLVTEGEPVMELDSSQVAGDLDNRVTALEQARNALEEAQADSDAQIAEKQLAVERARVALRKAEIRARVPADVQPRKQYQEAQLALLQARTAYDKAVADLEAYRSAAEAQLQVLRIDVAKARRDVQEARRAIDTMMLRAPRSGIIVAGENLRDGRKYQVGDTVSVGVPVFEIPDLSEMMIEAWLPDVDDGEIAVGMAAVCTLDAYPDRHIDGRVVSITPVAQLRGQRSERRHFRVRVDLAQADPEIMRPGMSVKVEVLAARRSGVPLVPRAALRFGADGVALVLAQGNAVPVRLGPCNALECVLEQGPPEGTELWTRR